jgi:FixJ family two-component response regulator
MRSVKDFSPFVAVVDDNAPLREAIESLLESAGYRARGYESAEAFLCSTAARRAACLILDAKLPGISGHELQHVLCLADNPVPVIFISAHDEIESGLKARALQLGALAFLRKPFGGDDLLRVVDNAMQLCNQRQ